MKQKSDITISPVFAYELLELAVSVGNLSVAQNILAAINRPQAATELAPKPIKKRRPYKKRAPKNVVSVPTPEPVLSVENTTRAVEATIVKLDKAEAEREKRRLYMAKRRAKQKELKKKND